MDEALDLLLAQAKAGNPTAQTEILRKYERLLRKLANLYMRINPWADFDDLMQEARIALLLAIGKFEPGQGFRFSTYMATHVRNALFRYVRDPRNRPLPQAPVDRLGVDILDAIPAPEEQGCDDPLDQLAPICRLLVEMRHGLSGREKLGWRTILHRVGLPRPQAQTLYLQALETLRKRGADIPVCHLDDTPGTS